MIEDFKKEDRILVSELNLRHFARVVGYDEFGSPIELVFDLDTDTYEWHIGGEYVKDATPDTVIMILHKIK